ncbi:hypothetical protein KXS12_26030 [Priestia filamentosa]|uniref:hypothetical protein n=1 Tax=Priestia filamentosa TaxID=1402861 RepID=UPI003F154572
MKNNIQVLPIVASIGIGAAAYSMMTGRGGQLQNMMPQLSNINNQGSNQMMNQQADQQQQQNQ